MLDCTGTLYAVVPWLPDVPPLDVLNMPTGRPEDEGYVWLPNGDRFECDYEVDLVLGWNAEEAAHIEAVTGWHLWQPTGAGWVTAGWETPDRLDYETRQDFREGVVAARFHVTGCHDASTVACGCVSPWELQYDLWHWTGHAEKVNP